MKILAGAGSSNQKLAKSLSNSLASEYIEANIANFEDGELRVQISENPDNQDIVLIKSICAPVNDNLMELLLMVDTVKRAGAKQIITVIPYLGYSRQDRVAYEYGPISASLIAKLLEAAGVTSIVTIDLHSKQAEGFFAIPIYNVDPSSVFLPFIKCSSNHLLVSPDFGSINRVNNLSKALKIDFAIITKLRTSNNDPKMQKITGNVKGKNCILIDDIIDSGQTIINAANLLRDNGALEIEAFVTHPVLSAAAAIERVERSCLSKVYITDTIETCSLPSKFHTLTINDLLLPIMLAKQRA